MKLLSTKQFYEQYETLAGQTVTVSGWVKTKRLGKEVGFVELGDGTCMQSIQVVVDLTKSMETGFGLGACVLATGVLTLTPDANNRLKFRQRNLR